MGQKGAFAGCRLGRAWPLGGAAAVGLVAAVYAAPAFAQTAGAGSPQGQWQTEAIEAAPIPTVKGPAAKGQGSRRDRAAAPKPGAGAVAGTAAGGSAAGEVEISAAEMSGDMSKTTFTLAMSRGVTAEIVTLANPYRVVIDMPNVTFRLPPGAGRETSGLAKTFRYGLFAEGKARIVIDTDGPVKVDRADMRPGVGSSGIRFSVDLVPTDAASFGLGTGASRAAMAAAQKPSLHEHEVVAPQSRAKPVIMIDPGHGGIDPGAIGATNLYEKTVVLAVARQLRAALAAAGRFHIVMTRQSDVFVSLDQRLRLSRQHSPDLFISLHADSIEAGSLTQAIRGASVYTLSESASDNLARLMAEKENASDAIAGLETAEVEGQDQVRSILIDLLKRETANFSADFSRTLVGKLGKSVPMSRDPLRSAAFKVLKQTGSPSVLIELGYMSNPEDEKLMASADWQKQVSLSIAQAVDQYFSRRAAAPH